MARPTPAPGVPIPTYPTALIEDSIEVEYVSVVGPYHPIPFGTKYNEIEHGAFAKDLPDHVLVGDSPTDASGTTRKRTWVSNRIDQDQYNFAISYESNNTEFPTYTRTYVLPREGYEPLSLLEGDTYDPFAYLIAEQVVAETEPAELRTVYLKVVRVFETLPGPITYQVEYPYGGNPKAPRITTKQKVAYQGTPSAIGTRCSIPNYGNAILIGQTITQTEFFAVDLIQSIFDVVPELTLYPELPYGSEDYEGQEEYGYGVAYQNGMRDYPIIVWRFAMGVDDYAPAPDLSPCPIPGYENLVLVNQEAKVDEKQNKVLRIERRYETLPGPLLTKVDYDNNEASYPILTTTQRVAVRGYVAGITGFDTSTVTGYTNLVLAEQHLAPAEFGVVRDDQRIYETNPSGVITSYDYDSAIDAVIETRRQKIIAGKTASVTDPLVLEYREKPVDKWRTITVQSKLLALPPTRIEYKTSNNWPFPTLLTGIALVKTGLVTNRNEVVWFPNTLRPIQNVPAILRLTTTYHTSPQPPVTIFVLPTRNIVYSGISFQLSISNVLNDAITLSVGFTGDTKYGNLAESVTFAATNPSATQYYGVVGQYRTVGCDISLWRGKLWVKTITEVILV